MKKVIVVLLLCFIAGYGIVNVAGHSGLPMVEVDIDGSEVTINDPSDVSEYMIGLKP